MSGAKGKKYKSNMFDEKALEMKKVLNIPDKEADEWEEAFAELDKDASGKIDATELIYVMRALGKNVTLGQVKDMINEGDTSGDGELDFAEFLLLMWKEHCKQIDYHKDLKAAFQVFDRDNSGTIDQKELQSVLTMLGDEPVSEEEAKSLIAMADTNDDGAIDYEEFSRMMNSPPSP